MNEKLTVRDIINFKKQGRKIVMITAYDYAFARLVDQAGVDIVLVGDSASMVMMGYKDTRFVKLSEMITFSKSVSRGVERALVVGDMPFMSFQVSKREAVRNAGRMVKEGMVDAVKLEGGRECEETVKAIVQAGIPVMGHIGLTPQSAAMNTGFRLTAKSAEDAIKIVEDARALERAGAFAIVAEYVTAEVAEYIANHISIPLIGIGSGPGCDGQVLVLHDLLGLYDKSPPFSKKYVDLAQTVIDAVSRYKSEVLEGLFPSEEYTKHMKKEEHEEFLARVGKLG
ncbi:MAG: 3-methyl-2-oxobutanoate hydroxymethyltransferase [Nitrososphaerota archaeon]|nr:3-methyl-2-oxobutanoate hydroxymethyltransferase [Candidatus Calditenuaceae archaeon]MDW8073005.1 3-methyl-2-oxobutanoate hydroxymethyltransferase [Nitrososphaerota archaeon]